MQLVIFREMPKHILSSFFDERHKLSSLERSADAMAKRLVRTDPLDPDTAVNIYAKPKKRKPTKKVEPQKEATANPLYGFDFAEKRAAIFN